MRISRPVILSTMAQDVPLLPRYAVRCCPFVEVSVSEYMWNVSGDEKHVVILMGVDRLLEADWKLQLVWNLTVFLLINIVILQFC
jgi:hypothetical protein